MQFFVLKTERRAILQNVVIESQKFTALKIEYYINVYDIHSWPLDKSSKMNYKCDWWDILFFFKRMFFACTRIFNRFTKIIQQGLKKLLSIFTSIILEVR